jgi:NADH-quinone oxidoreductase subunit D
MYAWRDREVVMDLLALITGNRINYGMNTIGGVRRDIDSGQAKQVLESIKILAERTNYYLNVAINEPVFKARLSGVGKLPQETALRLGAVGPTARASGIARDIRKDDPYAAYDRVGFKVVTDERADIFGRTVVRVYELLESYRMIGELIEGLPEGPIVVKAPRKIPAGEAVSRYEAPRGEDIHYVRTNGTEIPERVKVRAPTLANLASIREMTKGGFLADFPIIIAAIDPCFSCADRMIRISGDRRGELWSWEQLRDYSIAWHQKRGIDFKRMG